MMSSKSASFNKLPEQWMISVIGISCLFITLIHASKICDISYRHRLHPQNVTLLFKDISRYNDIYKVLQGISEDAKSIPDEVIHINKLSMIDQLGLINLKMQEVSSYALRFLEELSEFYHSRQKKISESLIRQRLNSRWEHLMFSILLEASYPEELGFTLDDVIRCERTNPLVSHTVDVIGENKFQWNQNFINGIKHHSWLWQMIELAGSTIAVGPSVACRQQLNQLVAGCPTNLPQSVSIGLSSKDNGSTESRVSQGPCYGYCQNVIRGCLAPPLLVLPMHAVNTNPSFSTVASGSVSITNLWQSLLSSPEGRPGTSYIQNTFDTLWYALNATKLVELIKQGLETAKREITVRKSRFKLLCRDGISTQGPVARSVITTEFTGSPQNEAIHDLRSERQKLVQRMKSVHDRLSKLAKDRGDTIRLIETAEQRYCFALDEANKFNADTSCWNGRTFGRYSKSVPPFTVAGQKENPEVKLKTDDFYPHNPVPRLNEDNAEGEQGENPQSDVQPRVSTNQVLDPVPKDDALWKQDTSMSSGFRPVLPDLGFIPDLHYPDDHSSIDNADKVESQLPSTEEGSSEASRGCSLDDEDCVAEFGERIIEESSQSEQNQLDSTMDKGAANSPRVDVLPSANRNISDQSIPELKTKPESISIPGAHALNASVDGAKPKKKNESSRLWLTLFPAIFSQLFLIHFWQLWS